MNLEKSKMMDTICKYCISRYQVLNNAPILSSLIYQLGRKLQIDIPAIRGILYVEVNGYKRQYAHCFNVYNGQIVDSTIYQYALINKGIEHLFPLYVVGIAPSHIDYSINSEIKYECQFKFKDEYLSKILKDIKDSNDIKLERFSLLEDSKKETLIF
ncbi:hypothetical protein Ccar_17460 [Clostridium carboxidivorans P7]|uniref:Uncharacterized protein n=1 Tax=Clostridium carboxidivorans P7 TaxID=536227 RepID=C6PZ75_9CLOT|nr:hypothetical protein [Clostridium carboxidivorans]AKN32549.1 hypothetical protein Ccar_17460 [Clostridium carboxidivorans P7]EET85473.1 conserved hypothetical protein [Clostridium carboxidivorans P7]